MLLALLFSIITVCADEFINEMPEGYLTQMGERGSRLSTIKSCDKIMYISNKGITECGTHEELLAKKGDYYKLYMAQKTE